MLVVAALPRPQVGPLFLLVLLAVTAALVALVRAYAECDDVLSGVRRRVDEARALLSRGDHRHASDLAKQSLELARSGPLRTALRQTLVWAALARDDCVGAHLELMKLDSAGIDIHLLCAYLACCRRDEEALALLEEARGFGQRSAVTTRLHLELLHRGGRREAALAIAAMDADLLSATDRAALERALLADA
jgi:hypothetical protein